MVKNWVWRAFPIVSTPVIVLHFEVPSCRDDEQRLLMRGSNSMFVFDNHEGPLQPSSTNHHSNEGVRRERLLSDASTCYWFYNPGLHWLGFIPPPGLLAQGNGVLLYQVHVEFRAGHNVLMVGINFLREVVIAEDDGDEEVQVIDVGPELAVYILPPTPQQVLIVGLNGAMVQHVDVDGRVHYTLEREPTVAGRNDVPNKQQIVQAPFVGTGIDGVMVRDTVLLDNRDPFIRCNCLVLLGRDVIMPDPPN